MEAYQTGYANYKTGNIRRFIRLSSEVTMTHTQLSLFGDAPAKEQIKRSPSVIQSGPIPDQTGYWYKLEINTLERSGHCKVCLQEVGTYKRQYHNCHTGQKVQSYYITPCQCRTEHFDQYLHYNEQGGHE